jgi:hypothetical protein
MTSRIRVLREASEMAFTAEQKKAWRNKPEVQARQANYNAEWDRANREQRAAYQRAYRSGKVGGGSSTTPPTPPTTTGNGDVSDADSA